MKTETFDNPADFLAALKPARTKRGRATRPDLPSAGRAEGTGLGPLILKGWSTEYREGCGYRMYRIGGVSTAWCVSEKAACDAAKEINK